MASITYLEPGTEATQDGSLFSSFVGTGTTGAISSATDQSYSGTRSVKIVSGATSGGGNATSLAGTCADTGTRINVDARYSNIDNVNVVFNILNSSGQSVFQLRFNASGGININNGTGTTLGTAGTIVLGTNVWIRITIVFTITSTTVNTIKVFINGKLDANGTNVTLVRSGSDRLNCTMASNTAAGRSAWYDNIYIDNFSTLDDPGDIIITAKRPFSNGTTNGFTTQIGSGGSGYGTGHAPQVNERPLSTTNGWSIINAGSVVVEQYNIEGVQVGDVDISFMKLLGYVGWVYASSAISETAVMLLNGTTGSNMALTSTNTAFMQGYVPTNGAQVYPTGTGSDIGIQTSNTVTTVSLYECGMIFAYLIPNQYPQLPSQPPQWRIPGSPFGRKASVIPGGRAGVNYTQGLSGSLDQAGALVKQTNKLLGGSLASTGTLNNSTNKTLSGSISPAGALSKLDVILVGIGGVLSFVGNLIANENNVITLSGSLSFVGDISKRTGKSLAGVLMSSGDIIKSTLRSLAGVLTSSGALVRIQSLIFDGILSFSGALVKQTQKGLAGVLTSSGSLAKFFPKILSGVLSFVGTLTTQKNPPPPGSSIIDTLFWWFRRRKH